MKKSNLIPLLRKLGVRPSRRLGQNFLIDQNLLLSISAFIEPKPNELIIEVGSGIGNLTDLVVASKAELIAIEYDIRLADYLRAKYHDNSSVKLIQADATRIDYDRLTKGRPYRFIGNLPYSASSVIVAKILNTCNRPHSMVLLLQKEMAERIQSLPGCKSYSSLSARTQAIYDIKSVKYVPPNLFWPVPKVASVLMGFNLKDNIPDMTLYREFMKLVNLGFSHRRKKIISNLRRIYNEDFLVQIFRRLKLSQIVRAEDLTATQYLMLTREYQKWEKGYSRSESSL